MYSNRGMCKLKASPLADTVKTVPCNEKWECKKELYLTN